MTRDRNYYRMLYNSELIDEAETELEIVLADRLDALLDVQDQLEHLQVLYDRLVAENNALRDDMAE